MRYSSRALYERERRGGSRQTGKERQIRATSLLAILVRLVLSEIKEGESHDPASASLPAESFPGFARAFAKETGTNGTTIDQIMLSTTLPTDCRCVCKRIC